MASDNEACCESDPNFAVICGFLEKFGVTCGLANIDFLDLQDMLENSQEVPQELVDLHVKLLRKARKSVSSERWERAIIKLCHGFCIQDAWEIERFGYKKARLSSKLRILKELLEMQFDYNAKFKNEINKLSAEELRTQPLGRDRVGHVYWFQSDNSCQIRVYKEDPDEETWSLVAKDREGLVNLITQLNDGQVTLLNEDSNSLESEKPVVDTGQTDSNSNSNSSKQDQASTDTNTEENQVEITKKEKSDSDKPQLDEEDSTQNNVEVAKLSKMRLKNNKVPISDDSSKAGESLGNGNGEGVGEQEPKSDTHSEKEEKDKCSSTTLSPPKTGISIRIKPISELISSSGVDVNKKLEITGVKEKYIRSDSSSSSSVYHRKAVDSAGFDVHTNYLKRPIEEEEDVQEPSYIKRPRLDRPTLLGNKKRKPYSDEEDEEEEEVSDEVEEPLMLVTGEGSGQDNEGGNSRVTETGSPIPEDDSPIVGEEIEESVVYFYGEGNGHECKTGNDGSPNKQDVAAQQEQSTTQNTTSNVDSTSDPNVQHTSHESNKADTIDSIKDSEPSSNNDETDCSVKTPTKSEFKLGTIIDVRTNKLISCARDPAKKSRWDIGKPKESFDNESQISTDHLAEETSEDANLQCNSNSDIKLESEKDKCEEQKIEASQVTDLGIPKSSKGKVQELVNRWEKFNTPSHMTNQILMNENEKVDIMTTADETTDDSMQTTPKKSMFFFGPGCLQVKPTISSLNILSKSSETDIEQEQMPTSAVDEQQIQEAPNLNSETQDGNPSISSKLELKAGSYEATLKTEPSESKVDSQSSKKEFDEVKHSDLKETFKKPQVQRNLIRNADSQSKLKIKHDVQKSDTFVSLKDKSEQMVKNMEKRQSSLKVLEKGVDCSSESKVVEAVSLKKSENTLDNNLLPVQGNSKNVEPESIKRGTPKISIQTKVAETSDFAKEISISTITETGIIAKNNEEKVDGDSKKCDNLKLSCVEEISPIKQPETSTSTILKLGCSKEEDNIDKICNLPNNIVTGNHHVPRSSVSKKELEKVDSSNSSISDDQKDNKLSDVPVSEKSHVSSHEESEKSVSVSPKVAGLPAAKEQVVNSNTSVLDNKPKSKLEDVQEDIKKVNIQKTDSIDLSIKNKDSAFKLESNVTTSEQPCSIEMQMAMIMGENLSDPFDFHGETLIKAKTPISSNKSSISPSKDKCLSDTKIILENPSSSVKQITSETNDNISISSVSKPPSGTMTATTSSGQKCNLESSSRKDITIQTVSKSTVASSNVKKIVLKRSVDKNVSSTNTPSSSAAAPTSMSKSAVDLTAAVHNKQKTPEVSSSLKKEPPIKSEITAPTIKSSIDKVPAIESSNVKKLDEKPSTDLVDIKTSRNETAVDTNLPISTEKSSVSSTDVALPITKSSKGEDISVILPGAIMKLDEKESSDKGKDVSSISKVLSEVKLPIGQPETVKKNLEDVATEKKLDDKLSPDTVSSISKPIIDTKSLNVASNSSDGSGDASPLIKEINAIKETSIIKPVVKKLTEKQSPDKVEIITSTSKPVIDPKPLVSANKSDTVNVGIVSSTVKVSENPPVKKSTGVKQDVKGTTSDKIQVNVVDSKSTHAAAVTSKASSDNFRIPAEYQSKKSSSSGVSSLTEKPVFNINEVIVNATSGIPSNVNKSRVISLTEILSTSEKVPLSATKGGISKPSTHKLPVSVVKEASAVASDVNKQSSIKSKGTIDVVVNKLSTDVKVPIIDKADASKVNKSDKADTVKVNKSDKTDTSKVDQADTSKVNKSDKADTSKVNKSDKADTTKVNQPDTSKGNKSDKTDTVKVNKSDKTDTSKVDQADTSKVNKSDKADTLKVNKSDKADTTKVNQPDTTKVNKSDKTDTSKVNQPDTSKGNKSDKTDTVKVNKSDKTDTSKVDQADTSKVNKSDKADTLKVNKSDKADTTKVNQPDTSKGNKSDKTDTVKVNKSDKTDTSKVDQADTSKVNKSDKADTLKVNKSDKADTTKVNQPDTSKVNKSDKTDTAKVNKSDKTDISKGDQADTSKVNKSPMKDALFEDKIVTNVKVLKVEANKESTPNLPAPSSDSSVKKPAAPTIAVELTDSVKDKPLADTKVPIVPIISKDKPLVETKQSVKPLLSKDEKASVKAKSSDEPSLKVKPSLEVQSVFEPTSSKSLPSVETNDSAAELSTPATAAVEVIKKSDSSKDKLSVGTKGTIIEPIVSKEKPLVETKQSAEPVLSKDKPSVETKQSGEPVPSKNTPSAEATGSAVDPPISVVEVKVNKKSDTSKDKPPVEIKDSHDSGCSKDKPLAEPALIKDKPADHIKDSAKPIVSKNKTAVEETRPVEPITPKNKPSETKLLAASLLSKNTPSVDAKDPVEVDVLQSKETDDSVKDNKVSVKTKSLIVESSSADVSIENEAVGKESIKTAPATPIPTRRVTRRTRSSTSDKSESGIDNKNKKPINNKISAVTKKVKKPIIAKSEATKEIADEKTGENEKPQKSDDADTETPKGKGKQKKKASKENDNEEKSTENKKINEPQITGDTNRELRHRKVTEINKNKPSGVSENEEKKPRGRGRPKGKANVVGTPKEEDKTVSSFTRSQAHSVKDKESTSKADSSKENTKKNETVDNIEDIEEQIVKTEIRPSKKLRLSDSSVEVTVIDKNKRTVTVTSEKGKDSEKVERQVSDGKSEPPKPRRSLRSSHLANTDGAGKTGKDQDKAVNEPKEAQPDADKKVKANQLPENQELKPVEEPLCVQKKVPLLTCIDINKLKAQPETASEELKSDINDKPIDSPESDDSCGFGGGGDVGIDSDGDSSDDAVIMIPENDPLASSDDPPEPERPPMTLSTFKLDVDDASPTPRMTRVTRKRAAQQSIDALRDTRIQSKKTQLEKKEEVDSKRPKLKKRSVDRHLRRSIEEQKLKAVSSSEEEEEDNNDDKTKSEPLVKQESGKKSKSIAKRRISTRSTRATESPVPSSDALSEASRTDASNTPPVIKEKKPRKTKKTLLGLEISEVTESLMKGDTPPSVRQSRRIAQQKIKEEAERRKLEEVTLQDLKDEQRKRKGKKSEDKDYKIEKRKGNKNLPTEDETTCDAESDEKKKRKRKRKHWDPTKKFDLFKAWKSSSGSSSSEVEDEEEEIEEDEDNHLVVKSDHEFSPESDLEEEGEVQPLKRARTARKESDAEEEVDDCACQKCGQKDHPEWILLCDSCDCGWHCSCLRPALLVIPEGDWFCPPCQHITLVKNLEERLHEYDRKINKREMETRRKERLAYVGISLDNVLPSKESDEYRQKQRQQLDKESGREEHRSGESGSDGSDSDSESSSSSDSDSDEPVYQLRERRQAHSYRFNDYDELINSAIQDEIEAVKGAGNQGRGKDIATIVNAEKEEAEAQLLKNEAVAAGTEVVPSDPTVATVPTDAPAPVAAADAAAAPETAVFEPLPPVVPPDYDAKAAEADDSDNEVIRPVKKHLGKKKHRKLNSLDVSSGDDAESDEDFKGSSSSESEEDFDEDEYSGSDSSEAETKRGKRRKDFGPVRRSTRARISRYDRDFVNDSDSEEEEAPRRKKTKSIWDESESEESDRSWGRRKRKAAANRSRRKSSGKVKKSKKKKKKRRTGDDSDPEVYRKRPNIKFGGLNDDEEVGRRTRGKKINYLEALGTDSEEEIRRKPPRIEESEEEYNLHEDVDFQQQLENEKDSDESGVDTVLQDIAKNTQPRPKARGRGKSGLKIPRKPKDAPPPEFLPLMPDLSQPPMDPPVSMMDPCGLQPLQQPLQSLQSLQPLMVQPPMLGASMVHESDLQDPEDEPNPIEQINKNVEQMNEQEMEKMMEEEDYANKQLQLVALQIEKEKKRKEREAKRLEKLMEKEQKIPKKRGRKPKNQMLGANADLVPPYSESASMLMNSVMGNNAELSEPPGVSLPMFSEIAPVLNADGSPKKRRGRGKGKKTLAAEAAAIAAANKDNPELEMGLEGHASSGSNTVSPAPDSPMHGTKLGIAAPPQPFAQSQPTPSVITRMLQSQPGQGGFPGGGTKYFGGLSGDPQLVPPPGSGPYHPGASGPRGPMSGPYQQPPPGMPHYPVVRSGPAPPHRLHSPGPPGLPPMYHTHRSMDPSPSGGGPINVSTTNRDRHSPAIASPSSSSPLSKGDPTPPPPPYTRPQVGHFAPGVVSSAAAGPRHVPMVPPHLQQHRGSGMSPYHPGVPPNYHYGSYPPPPPLNSDEGQSPPVYPSPAYSEPYPGEGGVPVQPSDGSSNKPFDEDTGGEFVGLVSYFSSQREDDLDT